MIYSPTVRAGTLALIPALVPGVLFLKAKQTRRFVFSQSGGFLIQII